MKKLIPLTLVVVCLLYWYWQSKSQFQTETPTEPVAQTEEVSVAEEEEVSVAEEEVSVAEEEEVSVAEEEEEEEIAAEEPVQQEQSHVVEAEIEEWDDDEDFFEVAVEEEEPSELEEVVLSEVSLDTPAPTFDGEEEVALQEEEVAWEEDEAVPEQEEVVEETVVEYTDGTEPAEVEEIAAETISEQAEQVAVEEEIALIEEAEQAAEEMASYEVAEPTAVEEVEQVTEEMASYEVAQPIAVEEVEQVTEEMASYEVAEPTAVEEVEQVTEEMASYEVAEPVAVEEVEQVTEEMASYEVAEPVAVEEVEQVTEEVASHEAAEPVAVEEVVPHEETVPVTENVVKEELPVMQESPREEETLVVQAEKLTVQSEEVDVTQEEPAAVVAKVEEPKPERPPLEIIEELQGLLFLGDWNLARREPLDCVEGIATANVALIAAHPEFERDLYRTFIGKPLTDRSITQLKQMIGDFYAAHHQPFVVVSVPRQEVTQGVLQVIVDEARLGEVRCKGNEYYTSQDLLRYLQIKPGEPVITKRVVEDVAFMNQNPFRHTDVLYTPGVKPGTTDIELITEDRWPYRIYAGSDNTGTISTERNRVFMGFNFGKTIIRDSEMSFQYTQSPNINRFYALTGLFRIPCPWHHTLQGYGGYTKVHPNTETVNLTQQGVSWQVDLRYRIPLSADPELLQEVILGYDFKETQNNTWLSSTKIFHGTADINQIMLGYELGSRNRYRKITLNMELYCNPGSITTHNINSSYNLLRYESSCQYAYFKLNHSFMQEVKGGVFFLYNLSGQVASTNLLPSEQFTMTGYNAVRGFEERILNLDNAALLNLTMELPHFSPAYLMGFRRYDDFYIHIFADMAMGGNHQPMPGEHRFYSLGSVGPGARYQFGKAITARFDYGVQLWYQNFNPQTHSRYNFGAILSY
ncbi:MAG: ShlB/FhaC/HecB family hemolysin secretion/activation protein [Verrucomicrobiota bacterium]|nr:ShlB/FhaC/HecB family hemolysin secretion/activation protein [Verrucomicrobiota bacterium]